MIEIGKINKLSILRETSVGLYLGDDSGEDVLLPHKWRPEYYEIDDDIEVFVYLDHLERKIATSLTPKIILNEFAFLRVASIETVGAFMDWGMEKDLMVPFSEQKITMEKGRWYVVYMDLDEETDRLYATSKLDKYLDNTDLDVKEQEEVDILVMRETEIGYSVIINNKYHGLVYRSDLYKELNVGERKKAFVKKIRDDNKIDISLQPIGYIQFNDANTELIMQALNKKDGFIPLTDKSSPDEISVYLGISKKAFKKAIGALYKQRKIAIEKGGIRIV